MQSEGKQEGRGEGREEGEGGGEREEEGDGGNGEVRLFNWYSAGMRGKGGRPDCWSLLLTVGHFW